MGAGFLVPPRNICPEEMGGDGAVKLPCPVRAAAPWYSPARPVELEGVWIVTAEVRPGKPLYRPSAPSAALSMGHREGLWWRLANGWRGGRVPPGDSSSSRRLDLVGSGSWLAGGRLLPPPPAPPGMPPGDWGLRGMTYGCSGM